MLKSVVVLCIILMIDGLNSEEFVDYAISDPWVVRFKFAAHINGKVVEIGGTFVHEHFVITTRACYFMDQNRQRKDVDYEVLTFRHKNLSNKNVTEIFVHEDYTQHPNLGDSDFDLVLIKFDLHYQHAIPVSFRKDYDYSKIKEVFFEEHKHLELLPKSRCYTYDDMCSTTHADHSIHNSVGAGLIYYDDDLNDNFMIGIYRSHMYDNKTNTFIVNYFRIRDFAEWIQAHIADDALTVENYCTKTDYMIPKQLMKPRIHTQGLINKYDWQVRIFNNVTQVACGGSLIKPDVVLTGSFCVKDEHGNVNTNSYSLKFNNIPEWQTSDIVLNVEYCNECYDNKHELINGADNIAMMYLTMQSTLKTITPIRMSNSKSFGELFQESFAHSAIVPAIRSIFEDGMSTFTVHRFISEKECSGNYPNVVGRICTNYRQEFGLGGYDLGGGLIYCNEETGEPMLYGVLIEAKDKSITYLHAYLGYYEKWIHF